MNKFKLFLNETNYHICKKGSKINTLMIKHIVDHYHCTGKYRGVTQSICSLKYSIPKEIRMVFHNWSNYHFIIKELAKEFEGEFNSLGENTEEY